MTAAEVAAWLHVNVSTIYRLARKNEIPCFHVGKDLRFDRVSVETWILAQHTIKLGS